MAHKHALHNVGVINGLGFLGGSGGGCGRVFLLLRGRSIVLPSGAVLRRSQGV